MEKRIPTHYRPLLLSGGSEIRILNDGSLDFVVGEMFPVDHPDVDVVVVSSCCCEDRTPVQPEKKYNSVIVTKAIVSVAEKQYVSIFFTTQCYAFQQTFLFFYSIFASLLLAVCL